MNDYRKGHWAKLLLPKDPQIVRNVISFAIVVAGLVAVFAIMR